MMNHEALVPHLYKRSYRNMRPNAKRVLKGKDIKLQSEPKWNNMCHQSLCTAKEAGYCWLQYWMTNILPKENQDLWPSAST